MSSPSRGWYVLLACLGLGTTACSDVPDVPDAAGADGAGCVAQGEVCDGVDNDCDGQIDEDFDVGLPCAAGVGACQAAGSMVCAAGGAQTECDAQAGVPGVESCANPGADDDCNGVADDLPGLGDPCATGLDGACAAGTMACADGLLSCVAEHDPSAETCADPGVDDDCDGLVDNIPGLGEACLATEFDGTPVLGACQFGTSGCWAAGPVCFPSSPGTEVCNELDDDCDGDIDNGLNLESDPLNCGSCGFECSEPTGSCCGAMCVDLVSDGQNCGVCGIACGASETCCGGECVDTNTDELHCGSCQAPCNPATEACCGAVCAAVAEDELNCGACGVQCAPEETCEPTMSVPPGACV